MPEGFEFDCTFKSSALEEDRFFLLRLAGHERLSWLFELEAYVQTITPLEQDEIDSLVDGTVTIALGPDLDHVVHGVARSVETLPNELTRQAAYRIMVVPRLWYTTHTHRSRVFLDKTAVDIVKQVLLDNGFADGDDFDLGVAGSYATRAYVVQYEETDYAFICRLLEHEGIAFRFEHGEVDKLVLVDAATGFPDRSPETVGFDPRGVVDDAVVKSITERVVSLPSKVALREYNWRTPSTGLDAEAPVLASGGRGIQVYYGEHYADTGAGKKLAQVRAEEWLATRVVYTGVSNLRGLRAGQRFTLEDHWVASLNCKYTATEVRHFVSQEPEAGEGSEERERGYHNELTAIPGDVQYRPPRVTPRPRIYGLMHAKIDGEQPGTLAPIDDDGSYVVILPFDVAGKTGGKATRRIRMAQPHSGAGWGIHFPLHIGAEVLLAHVDGDPDRPVIVGAVPDRRTMSPAVKANASQSVIRTRAAIHVELEDDAS